MQINRVYAQDFMSYEILDLPLADRGLVLVEGENCDLGGSNGSGKSSIFEAIVWTLFGSTLRDIKADGVIRRDHNHQPVTGKTMGFVEIDLDGKLVQVFRYRKHREFDNKLVLCVNGNDISAGSDSETLARIEELLQITEEAFISSVMFPQGGRGFASLKDSAQKEILDSILGTSRIDKAKQRVKDALTPLLHRKASLDATIRARASQADTELRNAEKYRAEYEKELNSKAQRILKLEQELSTLEASVPAVDERIFSECDKAAAEVSKYKVYEAAARQAVSQRTSEVNDLNRMIGRLEGQLLGARVSSPPTFQRPEKSEAEYEAEVVRLQTAVLKSQAAIGQAKRNIQQIQSQLDSRASLSDCPTCGYPLDDHRKTAVLGSVAGSIDAEQKTIAEETAASSELQSRLSEAKTLKSQSAEWSKHDRELASAESAEKARIELESQLQRKTLVEAELQRASQYLAEFDAAKSRFDDLNRRSESARQARAKWESSVSTQRSLLEAEKQPGASSWPSMIEEAERKVAEITAAVRMFRLVLQKLDEDIKMLLFWEEGFSNRGVKSLLIDHVMPVLTDTANTYLHVLTDGQATMSFNSTSTLASGETRDKMSVSVSYSYGAAEYGGVSGGECRRADLASLFALGDLAASRSQSPIKLRLLDEPFESLDSVGAEQVVRLLNTHVVPKSGTVLVMTHDENLKSLIQNRITVVKARGVSSICS